MVVIKVGFIREVRKQAPGVKITGLSCSPINKPFGHQVDFDLEKNKLQD